MLTYRYLIFIIVPVNFLSLLENVQVLRRARPMPWEPPRWLRNLCLGPSSRLDVHVLGRFVHLAPAPPHLLLLHLLRRRHLDVFVHTLPLGHHFVFKWNYHRTRASSVTMERRPFIQGDQGTLQQIFIDFIWNVPLLAGFALGRRKPGNWHCRLSKVAELWN